MYPTLLFDDQVIGPAQIEDRSRRAAAGLLELGLDEGAVIAVMLRNEPAAIEAILAARHIGAYWCGLNWHFKAAEAKWILEDSGAKILIVHADLLGQIADGIPPDVRVLVVDPQPLTVLQYGITGGSYAPAGVQAWDAWVGSHAAAGGEMKRPRGFMPYTSGTTGRPKGVKRLPPDVDRVAAQMAAAAAVSQTVFGIGPEARALLAAPLYHSAPASYINFCAQAGATLRLEPKFDALRLLALIERDRTSHLYLVPTMYQRLLRVEEPVRALFDVSSVQFVASTGSPCPPKVKKAMIEWWGPVIHEAYASSETGYVTFIHAEEWLTHPGSAGRPAGSAEVRILDDEGNQLPPLQIGVIYARQPAYPNFVYANNEAARKAMERDGFVTLGDMGYLDEDGYLYISDRKSDMVISGGVNIYPAEIEAVLSNLAGVADCAVFGIPDDEWGEALAAVVQRQENAALSELDVRRYLREHLAGYKVPKMIDFQAELPREDTGKIFKRKLRAGYWEGSGRSI